VILCERRAWLGGDARYYGAVGEQESPEAATGRLVESLVSDAGASLLPRTNVLSLDGTTALAYQTVIDGTPHGRLISIAAKRTLLATGTAERLPIFPGNRLPGVAQAIEAYHLAKRYGVVHGASAVVATQGNVGYRLALRLSDAGVAVRRIVDARPAAQSRFIDFAKASGLILATGQAAAMAAANRDQLTVTWHDVGSGALGAASQVSQLIVAGHLQPDLALWMSAGGRLQWNSDRLMAAGHLDHVALTGAVAGYRSMMACAASGRSAVSLLLGSEAEAIDDVEIGAPFETPEVSVGTSPVTTGAPAFLDAGTSLARRETSSTTRHRELSAGDVAAQVALHSIAPGDAGAIAEEHGAPGGDIVTSSWTAAPKPAEDSPPWLGARLGPDHLRLHLVVDGRRQFERGALVYRNTGPREPHQAIGVIVAPAAPGGIALVAREHGGVDRFIVEGLSLTSPARIAPAP
jgi:sarcosine oxidase subunit alpha